MGMKIKSDSTSNAALRLNNSNGDAKLSHKKQVLQCVKTTGPSGFTKIFKDQIAEKSEQILGRRQEIALSSKKEIEPTAVTAETLAQEVPDYIKEIGFTAADFFMPSREDIALKVKKAMDNLSKEDLETADGKYKPVFLTPQPRGGGPLPKPKKL